MDSVQIASRLYFEGDVRIVDSLTSHVACLARETGIYTVDDAVGLELAELLIAGRLFLSHEDNERK